MSRPLFVRRLTLFEQKKLRRLVRGRDDITGTQCHHSPSTSVMMADTTIAETSILRLFMVSLREKDQAAWHEESGESTTCPGMVSSAAAIKLRLHFGPACFPDFSSP